MGADLEAPTALQTSSFLPSPAPLVQQTVNHQLGGRATGKHRLVLLPWLHPATGRWIPHLEAGARIENLLMLGWSGGPGAQAGVWVILVAVLSHWAPGDVGVGYPPSGTVGQGGETQSLRGGSGLAFLHSTDLALGHLSTTGQARPAGRAARGASRSPNLAN